MNTSGCREILDRHKKYILISSLGLLQALNLFAIHLFIGKRFLTYGKVILAVINSSDIKYNTPEYYRALDLTVWILSLLIGGVLVLALNKLLEKLGKELQILDKVLYVGAIPAAFCGLHLLGVLGLWIFNRNVYGWLLPMLAYAIGTGLWVVSVRKEIFIEEREKE